jgi:hypothetical protein
MKTLEKQICAAVEAGTLAEPFNAAMIRVACPGWADRDYHIVLCDHTAGGECSNELFERVSFGLYRLYQPTNPEPDDQRTSAFASEG